MDDRTPRASDSDNRPASQYPTLYEHCLVAAPALVLAEAVGQTRRLARSCTKSTTARFWRGSNQSSKAVDCREAALHDLGLETAGARLWLFYKAIPLSDSHGEMQHLERARRESRFYAAFLVLPTGGLVKLVFAAWGRVYVVGWSE